MPARRYRVVNKGKPAQRSVVLRRRCFVVLLNERGRGRSRPPANVRTVVKRSARGIAAADRVDRPSTPPRRRNVDDIRSCDGGSVIWRRAQWINAANVSRVSMSTRI